jgi:hypothetical protein
MMITTLPLLSHDECRRVRDDVRALVDHWLARPKPPSHFHTLGVNSYMDLGDPDQRRPDINYYRDAGRYAQLLMGSFAWLYERVRVALEEHLKSKVVFDDLLAIPGFHIFEVGAIPTQPTASIHFDLQYLRIDWSGKEVLDRESPISFTLPVALPRAGGGLRTWNLSYREMERAVQKGYVQTIDEMRRFKTCSEHAYSEGVLQVHSGHMLHQIAPIAGTQTDDERITLQGHGVRRGDNWVLYW